MVYTLKAVWFVVKNSSGALLITKETLVSDSILMGPVSYEAAYQFVYGA